MSVLVEDHYFYSLSDYFLVKYRSCPIREAEDIARIYKKVRTIFAMLRVLNNAVIVVVDFTSEASS